jgi:hypothetical protein
VEWVLEIKKGEGAQVDLLLLGSSQLSLANQFIRWILVDGTRPKESSRFVIFDNKEAKNAVMGGVKRGKQNNLRVNDSMKNPITWTQLIESIKTFIILQERITSGRRLTERVWLRAFGTPPKLLAPLGTSDTLSR